MLAFALLPAKGWSARKVVDDVAKVELQVPDNWKESRDAQKLILTAPEDSITLVFVTMPEAEIDKALAEADKILEESLGEIDWSEEDGEKGQQISNPHKLTGSMWMGTAQKGDVTVVVVAWDNPAENYLCMYYMATKVGTEKYDGDMKAIIQSLKPIGGEVAEEEPAAEEGAEEDAEEGAEEGDEKEGDEKE